MHKVNILKIVLILISVIFILHFQFAIEGLGLLFLIPVLFLLTSYMYKYKSKIKKCKFIYDVILMLLIFFSSLVLLFVLFNISNILNIIMLEPVSIFIFGGLYLLLKIFIDSIITRNEHGDKINNLLIIISFSIINLVFIRYYFDIKNVFTGDIESTYFIRQNYIYFFIMMLIIESHKYISKKFLGMN